MRYFRPDEGRIYQNDRLVIRWQVGDRHYFQGKRVPKNCPIPREVVREYVTKGAACAVKMWRDMSGRSLSEVWEAIRDYKDYKEVQKGELK